MKRIARFGPYVGMLAVAAIVHGLLLFNDGIYWDDWLWILALKAKDWPRIRVAGFSRGAPLDAYFDWFFSMFRNTESAHRLVAFLSILLIAILTRALCRQAGRLSRVESWWVAVLAMVYPAFQ